MDLMQVVTRTKNAAPPALLRRTRSAVGAVNGLRYRGEAVHCPVCDRGFSRFISYNGRSAARCPYCRALERHRMLWLFLERNAGVLTTPQSLLHIAPEPQLERRLRGVETLRYVTGDLLEKEADLQIDVTDIDLPDASFDAVICSHVLEHVDDDRAAMRELRRIVKPGGWGVLEAPVDPALDDTYEDWSITGPADRRRVFGQWDHVRLYGSNLADLLREAGWHVEDMDVDITPEQARLYGVSATKPLMLCRNPG